MPEYEVAREVLALVAVHASSDTAALGTATHRLESRLRTALTDRMDVALLDASVETHPGGPGDTHLVTVPFVASVVVEAPDRETARERGAAAVDDALARLDLDWEYATGPRVAG